MPLPEIYTASDLYAMSQLTSFSSPVYTLMSDIQLSIGYVIGNITTPFDRIFQGNDYKVSGWNISSSSDHIALFGVIGDNAQILNIKLDGQVSYGDDCIALLVGYLSDTATGDIRIENCHVSGSVKVVDSYCGLLAGSLNAGADATLTIEGCSADGIIEGSAAYHKGSHIGYGLLCGRLGLSNGNVIVKDCHTSGSLKAHHTVGGFIGYCYGGSSTTNDCSLRISKCSAQGITIENWWDSRLSNATDHRLIGLFIGRDLVSNKKCHSYVEDCYATGAITGNWKNIGGFAGDMNAQCHYKRCYCEVDITLTSIESWHESVNAGEYLGNIGGFTGDCLLGDTIEDCYAKATISLPDATSVNSTNNSTMLYTGGFVGQIKRGTSEPFTKPTIKRCYCDSQLTNVREAFGDIHYEQSETDVVVEDCYYYGDAPATSEHSIAAQSEGAFMNWDFQTVYYLPVSGGSPKLRVFGDDDIPPRSVLNGDKYIFSQGG